MTNPKLIQLIATDRLDIPISSLSGKLKRAKPKIANSLVSQGTEMSGDRAYGTIREEDRSKARGMREGVEAFSAEFPKYGKILNGMIEEKRVSHEVYLDFGMNSGKRLAHEDYISVLTDLGFTEKQAEDLYQPLIDASNRIARKRNEQRSILVG